ncbi:hypothetical protein L204_104901 [Cryptococcus depauperatus]|nr:hypothetical protein L204_05411 [Cryptococcus depauperatus CBS 7855]
MYTATVITTLLATLVLSNAIQITSPNKDTVWKSGESQTVEWKAVNSDPDHFSIQLVNQAGFLQNSPVTLVPDQQTGDPDKTNSASVSFPDGHWPEGTAFQINFVSTDKNNNGILAQSNQFNITSDGKSSSGASTASTSAASSSTTSAKTSGMSHSTSGSMASVTNSGGASASGNGTALPNTSKPAGAIAISAGIFSVVLAAAVAVGVVA